LGNICPGYPPGPPTMFWVWDVALPEIFLFPNAFIRVTTHPFPPVVFPRIIQIDTQIISLVILYQGCMCLGDFNQLCPTDRQEFRIRGRFLFPLVAEGPLPLSGQISFSPGRRGSSCPFSQIPPCRKVTSLSHMGHEVNPLSLVRADSFFPCPCGVRGSSHPHLTSLVLFHQCWSRPPLIG
jgi:hypothetical protein